MSEETEKPEESTKPEEQLSDPRTPITLTYAGASQMVSSDKDGKLALFSNTRRAPVQADAGRLVLRGLQRGDQAGAVGQGDQVREHGALAVEIAGRRA